MSSHPTPPLILKCLLYAPWTHPRWGARNVHDDDDGDDDDKQMTVLINRHKTMCLFSRNFLFVRQTNVSSLFLKIDVDLDRFMVDNILDTTKPIEYCDAMGSGSV